MADQPQGHLQGRRAFAGQDRRLRSGPAAACVEGGHDLFDGVETEKLVELLAMLIHWRGAGIGGQGRERFLNRRPGDKRGLHLLDPLGWKVVRRDAQGAAIRRLQPGAGQGQPGSGLPRHARQMPAAADVGEQTDVALGHGPQRPLGGDPDGRRHGDPDAAAHGDPVDDGDHRLGIPKQKLVHPVLGSEEPARVCAVALAALRHLADVAAGAEAPLAGVVDQHQPDSVVVQPGQQGLVDRLAHAGGERVQRPWPVQRHPTGGPVDTGNDFRVLAHRFRSSMGTALRVDADSMALSRDASVAPSVSASRR